MRCALIVTTHERPDALQRVLESVARQSRPPDELLIADDGSGPATAALIERHADSSPSRVRHLHQAHEGFRAARARNLAIAATGAEYVLLLDGDMLIDRHFVADHLSFARPGHYTQGVRIPLDAAATSVQLRGGAATPGPATPGADPRRRIYARRCASLSNSLRYLANHFVAIKSCNQGFWHRDLLAVNGFDEAMRGWGSEDKELCVRLENAGVRRQTLVFGAVAFHLQHPPATRVDAASNRERWLQTRRTGGTRCDAGVDAHLGARSGPAAGTDREPLL